MVEKHEGERKHVCTNVDIVYSLVIIEECQRAVWSRSVMTVSTYGKCQQPEEPVQGWYV